VIRRSLGWVLSRRGFLLLVLVASFGALLVDGYAHRSLGDSSTSRATSSGVSAVPSGSGPVLDLSGRSLRTAGMPARTIALTFDDGPDPTWTPKVLQVLREERVPGTFFVVGARALESPGLVREEARQGEVGLHTFTHVRMSAHPPWQNRLEMSLAQQAVAAAAGIEPTLMRPPYSSTVDAVTPADLQTMRQVTPGYLIALADRDSQDWARPGVPRILQNARPAGTAGAVIMFHDGGGDRSQTVTALRQLIVVLKSEGYRFTTVGRGVGLSEAVVNPRAPGRDRILGTALMISDRTAQALAWVLGGLLFVVFLLSMARVLILVVYATIHHRRTKTLLARTGAHGPAPLGVPVSVIVPAYNEAVGVEQTLRSLAASDYPDVEIVVVDDGSTDDTVRIVQSLQSDIPRLRLVQQANAGKAHALNAGLAATTSELVVLLDGDTLFEPDTIRWLVAPLADPGVGAVSGNTKVGNRNGLLGRWQHIEYAVGFNLDRRLFDLTNCMQTVPGAIGAFRRAAINHVGGIPTDTLAEDTDLTIALGVAGWRVAYEGQARAWTEAPSTLAQLWSQRYRWGYGMMQAVWKHRRAIGRGPVTGPGGATTHMGRLGIPYLMTFGMILPMLAPLVDAFALVGLLYTSTTSIAIAWIAFGGIQVALAGYALHMDGERLRTLWALPLQQFVYRQLLYLVVIEGLISALTGSRLRWHKLDRSGTAANAMTA
jgi:poly-beta-1,6 N-acetyl-D-glucosamine synthase